MTPEDLDQRYVWHPFAPMAEWLTEPPLVIERAEGNELIDTDGRRYLDGVASLWVNVHGHRHPHIDAAIRAQLDKVAHSTLLGLGNTTTGELARRLISVAPRGLTRAFFSDSGSTAVEVALKMAFQHHQLQGDVHRTRFLALENAYHGDTIGSVSLGGIDAFHRIFHPLLFHTLHCPPTIAGLRAAFAQHGKALAAFIVEPLIQGAAGMRLMPNGLLSEAASLCRQHGVLLIADEVATGFGRTGTLFACEQENVTPDLMCVAKGLSGGYLPVAATLANDRVFDSFLGPCADRRTFFHGHSFGGNPLGCAAAVASLELFERERTLERLAPKIARLASRLAEQVAGLPHVFEVRQGGMMIGIELRQNRVDPYPASAAIAARACRLARQHGVILRPLEPVVVLMPPLSITNDEIDRLVATAARAITDATNQPFDSTAPLPPARPPLVAPSGPRSSAGLRAPGLIIVGTDTNVGKTAVACGLLRLASDRGFTLHPVKPVETGCAPHPADARRLTRAARSQLPLERVCPFPLRDAVAPSVAAEQQGNRLELSMLVHAVQEVSADGPVLVETAGGVLTPITPTETVADLAAALGYPVLLVARNALGTVSHTALTINELRRRGLSLAGLVLVNTSPVETVDQSSNARSIEQLTGCKPMGTLPFVQAVDDDDALARSVDQSFDAAALFRSLQGN